jgi:hypothetical protein
LFDPTDGVDVSSIGSSSAVLGGVAIEEVLPTANGVSRSATSRASLMMDINSAALSSSTWKLNNPKVISKPPILAEVDPIKHEIGSTTVVTGGFNDDHWSGFDDGWQVKCTDGWKAMSTTAGEVMPTMVGDAALMSMAGDVVSMSMWMASDTVSMSMTGDAESTPVAGDEPSTLVDADVLVEAIDAGRSMVVGKGASESVDPDPVGPTVGAN